MTKEVAYSFYHLAHERGTRAPSDAHTEKLAGMVPPAVKDDNTVLLGAPVELVGTTLGASLHEDFKLTTFTAPIALGTEFVL